MKKPLIVGNWKMYKTIAEAVSFAEGLVKANIIASRKAVIAPAFVALAPVAKIIEGTSIALASQNAHDKQNGAYTGEVSPAMLKDVGCDFVIIGHSERRSIFGEDDGLINRKVNAVLTNSLTAIVCVGETLTSRKAGEVFHVIKQQLAGALAGVSPGLAKSSAVIAYEPVWAIGTGETATPEIAQEVHHFIRKELIATYSLDVANSMNILYGGSVKADNVSALMAQPDIDGALVGAASLDLQSFIKIVNY